jgi:hypothetical protein
LPSAIAHDELQLRLHDFEHAIDTSLPECAQTPQHRPPDAHSPGAQRQRLEHVGAAAHAAIQKNRDAVADRGHHFRQRLDRAASGFRGTPSMVRDQYAVDTVLQAELGVFARIDALDDELALQ